MLLSSLLVLNACQVALAGNTETCIVNTGGTCAISSCAAWRGSTKCDANRCFCSGGTCAGTDQACHPTSHADNPYTKIDSDGVDYYELQNSRWPNYFAYVQVSGALRLSTDHDGDTSLYQIRRPPSDGGEPGAAPRPKSYVVLSKKWPTSSIMVSKSDDAKYTPSCNNIEGALGGAMPDPAILDVSLTITKAPADQQLAEMTAKGQVLVMLSNPKHPNQFLYVSKTSWTVATWKNDPGAGGYWYIKTRKDSKPLPESVIKNMFTFSGARCTLMCGTAGSGAHATRKLSLGALAAVLAAVSWSAA